MTIQLIFKGDVALNDIGKAIWPGNSGHAISTSSASAPISRHDITVGKSGSYTWVRVDGVGKSELSEATINSIKEAVPTDFIRIEDV